MRSSEEKGGGRVCVPVCVKRAAELRPSIERAAEVGDIVELRLDCLDSGELDAAREHLGSLLERVERPFLITYRPKEQGGGVSSSLEERAAFWREVPLWLRGAAVRGRAFVDVELDLLESPHVERFGALFESFTVICSHHDFEETPADLERIYERMARTRAEHLEAGDARELDYGQHRSHASARTRAARGARGDRRLDGRGGRADARARAGLRRVPHLRLARRRAGDRAGADRRARPARPLPRPRAERADRRHRHRRLARRAFPVAAHAQHVLRVARARRRLLLI